MKESGTRAKPADSLKKGPVAKAPVVGDSDHGAKLADLGISKDQSSQWQALAEIPDAEFDA